MSVPARPDLSRDIKIRWVVPNFAPCGGANTVRDEERRKAPADRAEVFAIDSHATSTQSALNWSEHYRAGLGPEDAPACVVVHGRRIEP